MCLSAQHPTGGACCPQILARFEGEGKGGKEGKGGEKRRNKGERRGENTQNKFLVMSLVKCCTVLTVDFTFSLELC